jgi:hypothetical protein
MTALAQAINYKQVGDQVGQIQVPIKSATQIWQGAMVCLLTASGYAVPAGTAATGAVMGVARATATKPGTDGAANVNLLTGVFAFSPDATNTPTIAHVGRAVYAKDDNTLSYAAADGPYAGILVGFESTSGWPLVFISPETNSFPSTVTGALSTVADAPAKAVLTSILSALVAHGIVLNSTT